MAARLLVFLLLCTTVSTGFRKADADTFTIRILNAQQGSSILISLCNNASQWTDKGFMMKRFERMQAGRNDLEIPELKSGTYAFALFEDRNGNDKMDKNFIGIPKEPYAFSNNKKPRLSVPSFKDCSFRYEGGKQVMEIRLLD